MSGSYEIAVPFDATIFSGNGSQIYTGLAIANLDASNSANVSCTARDAGGNVISNAISVPQLNPLGQWAAYMFPLVQGQVGTFDCTSNTLIGAIATRALGTNALSSLPVISLPASNSTATKIIPDFGVGASFVTDFYVINMSTSAAKFSIVFHDGNGNPVAVPFGNFGSITTLSEAVFAGGAELYEFGTPTTSPPVFGSAIITSEPGITIQAVLRRLGSDGSYYEAAVPAISGSIEIEVPFDATTFSGNNSQIYTGLAGLAPKFETTS